MTVPRQEYNLEKNRCDKCVHCTQIIKDEIEGHYYFCEISTEYMSEKFALNEKLRCDAFVKELDDNEAP